MATCGFRMSTTIHGDPITMDDGFGTPSAGGPGVLMSHGDGVSPIMAVGTGEVVWDGIGSRREVGGPAGCIGITAPTISAGVR
jgi:hypothetical protein